MMDSIPSHPSFPVSPTPSYESCSTNSRSFHTLPTSNDLSLNYLSPKQTKSPHRIPISEIISLFDSKTTTTASSKRMTTASLSISSGSSDSSSFSCTHSNPESIHSIHSNPSTPLRSNTPSLLDEPIIEIDSHEHTPHLFHQTYQATETLRASTNSVPVLRYKTITHQDFSHSEVGFLDGVIRKRATSSLGLVPPRLPPRPLSFGDLSKVMKRPPPPPLPPRKSVMYQDLKQKNEIEENQLKSKGVDGIQRNPNQRQKVIERVWKSVEVNGFVKGILVRKIWIECGLKLETLAKIWDLVVDGNTSVKDLNYDQFCLGFKLIDRFLLNQT